MWGEMRSGGFGEVEGKRGKRFGRRSLSGSVVGVVGE